jgi:hypothetical protein
VFEREWSLLWGVFRWKSITKVPDKDKAGKEEVGTLTLEKLELSGLEPVENPACTVTSVEATELPYKGILKAREEKFFLLLKGVSIQMTTAGSECTAPAKNEIKGSLEGEWQNSTSTIVFPKKPLEGSNLMTGKEKVTFEGEDKLLELEKGGKLEVGEEHEAGPFWHHRASGSKGEGEKIEPKAPENLKGEGGEQRLVGSVAKEPIEISSKKVQIKGALFNNALQGQIKQELIYNQPRLVAPNKPNCVVTVGEKNIVQIKGHLMWKWNGEAPNLTYSASEPQEATKELKAGVFTTVSLKGAECGILAGVFAMGGSEVGLPNHKREEFSKSWMVTTAAGEPEQEFWNGKEAAWLKTGLLFAGNPASLTGQTTAEPTQQEIAIFEN